MRSSDNGVTWNPIDSGLPNYDYLGLPETYAVFAFGSREFVSSNLPDLNFYGYEDPLSQIYVSSNEGNSWSLLINLSYAFNASSVSFANSDSAIYISTPSYVLRSLDSGLNWDTLGLPAGAVVRSFQNGLVVVEGNIVSRLYTNGQTEFLMSFQNLPSTRGFTADDSFIYVATASDGIWRTDIANVPMGVRSATSEAAQPSLSIYPNPQSSKTTIAFDLSFRTNVSLRLYDELGILRADIFEGEMEAGHHEIPFANQELADGIYSVVLSSDENRLVGRLLIKR
jgi:hypothetical protein